MELVRRPVVEPQVEGGAGQKFCSKVFGQLARLFLFAETQIQAYHIHDIVVICRNSERHAVQRVVLHHLATLVEHLQGAGVLAGTDEGLGCSYEEAADRKHAEIGIHILVVDEEVSGADGVELSVKLVRVHEAGFGSRGLVLYRNKLE